MVANVFAFTIISLFLVFVVWVLIRMLISFIKGQL